MIKYHSRPRRPKKARMTQKDTAFVELAKEVGILYRSGYRVDAFVTLLLALGYVDDPKAKDRILEAILDLVQRDKQPTEFRGYPWQEPVRC